MGHQEQHNEWGHGFHTGHHHHHHGHHMHGMRPPGMGWGRRPMGFMFFPPLFLLFGVFMLIMLFKTGLWIPLLLIGAFLFFVRPMMMGRRGWGSMGRADWDGMRDKMKNEWRNWNTDDTATTTPDKPKRGDDVEFV